MASADIRRSVDHPAPSRGLSVRRSRVPRARTSLRNTPIALSLLSISLATAAISHADGDHNDTVVPNNLRLNNSVIDNVYTVQHQAGCTNDVKRNSPLQLAAQWHTQDVLAHRELNDDIGTDGSSVQSRAQAAGFRGTVQETVAVNNALAISGIELINQWYYNPAYLAIMQNCDNTRMGVWSESSFDRTVLVAVYGHPA
jgi:hypothetical protein